MNRKWIYRAVGAAVVAGGMLLLGAGTANAGVPVAGDGGGPVTVAPQRGGQAHPIMVGRDPKAGANDRSGAARGSDTFRRLRDIAGTVLPGSGGMRMHPMGGSDESATDALPGVSAGNPPATGPKVDVPQLTHAAGGAVAPVTRQAGPLAAPVDGLTGTEATRVSPLPVTAVSRTLPLGAARPEAFTVGKGTQLPTDGLVGKVGSAPQLAPLGRQVAGVAGHGLTPADESATESGALGNLAQGTNVAGVPAADVSGPVADQVQDNPLTRQLTSGNLTGTEAAPSKSGQIFGPTDATTPDRQPSGPTAGLTGSNGPLGTVTAILPG